MGRLGRLRGDDYTEVAVLPIGDGPGAPRSTLLMNSSFFFSPGLERLASR
jgi:hypothetical protein